ncbi:hypothetical protein [Ruminococcus sp.]|uniref:hypothetical protein n=1 Tax=Ruminococcus sp. TaxID=41978 RepID=UPI00388EBB11
MPNEKKNQPEAPATPEEKNFEEHQTARKSKVKLFSKRFKWYHLLAAVILLVIISLFVIWHLLPKKVMNVAVLDKTVLSYADDENIIKENVYRKHQGLYWILHQRRYVKPDGKFYDYQRDYFGPKLDEEGHFAGDTNLKDADSTPDLLYLSDAYGMGNDTYGYYNGGTPLNGGISDDDMSYISFAHESGAPIVAEMAFFSTPLSDSVRAQLVALTGVNPTKWIGRYLVDLEDFTDVPDWAPPMYEQQEGVEWRFTGPGILLVSTDGEIIVLEQNTDFITKNLLKIYINEEYRKEFSGCDTCNFYNWFELVEPNYGVETLATFEFDLNATGMEKIKDVSKTPRFCAISRKQEEGYAPVYYFAGDSNDYVNGNRYGDFLFSNQFFKFLSYDRQGDISNFFWRFYNPLMRHILADTDSNKYGEEKTEHQEVSRVNNGSFQVLSDEKWRGLNLKAASLNAQEPGKETYSRDFTFYEDLIASAGELGVNCVVAKDLYPPEFYAAISRYNKNPENEDILILQRVTVPDGLEAKDYLTNDGLEKWKASVTEAVAALHGDGHAQSEKLGAATYFIDVSEYVLGLSIDPQLSAANTAAIPKLDAYTYSGDYVKNSKGAAGFAAYLYDTAQAASHDSYGYYMPVAVSGSYEMVKGMKGVDNKNAYVFNDVASADCQEYAFCDITLDNAKITGGDAGTANVRAKYASAFSELKQLTSPVLASGVSFSDVNAVYTQKAVTEAEQGEALTAALSAAKDSGILGATVYDLNDSWGDVSPGMQFYTASASNSYLWHNTCDSSQMTGVIAMDSVMPETPGLVLTDDDLAQAVSMYSDAGYLYITLQLLEEIDYKDNAMFIGLDTFQRNDGEYYYAKDFTANSLSGMEFSLRFEGKQQAALYVIETYDRSRGAAYTKESYTGNYQKVADLSYGGFTSGDTQFYQTGSTIYVRLPWTWLNVADPSKKLVINDNDFKGDVAKSVTTNGVLASIMVGERKEGDLMYAFPENKHDPGYKVFQWEKWETAKYSSRRKESFDILKAYYLGQK